MLSQDKFGGPTNNLYCGVWAAVAELSSILEDHNVFTGKLVDGAPSRTNAVGVPISPEKEREQIIHIMQQLSNLYGLGNMSEYQEQFEQMVRDDHPEAIAVDALRAGQVTTA